MPDTFYYTARTAEGRLVRGAMRARDAQAVVADLQSRALLVTAAVTPAGDVAAQLVRRLRAGRIPRKALTTFFRSFATMIGAGIAIGRALQVTMERADDPRLAETLRSVLADIEHGSSLAQALERRAGDFPPLCIAMIAAGEVGGILDDVLERLATFLERDALLRAKVRSALAYPAIVLISAVALIILLLVKIVPMFADIFASFHLPLPPQTQFLLALSSALSQSSVWADVTVALVVSVVGYLRLASSVRGSIALDRLRLRAPIVGALVRKAIAARSARTLATLLAAGVELTAAIDAIVPATGSPCFARALQTVNADLREGRPLAPALAAQPVFDPIFVALVAAGEESGRLDAMLLSVAGYFERDVDAAVATAGAVIEPLLIVTLGTIVAAIVSSIFIPLYTLIGNAGR